jgi:hypothetical protein
MPRSAFYSVRHIQGGGADASANFVQATRPWPCQGSRTTLASAIVFEAAGDGESLGVVEDMAAIFDLATRVSHLPAPRQVESG